MRTFLNNLHIRYANVIKTIARNQSSTSKNMGTLDASKLQVTLAVPKQASSLLMLPPKPEFEFKLEAGFGKYFTDHMLRASWTKDEGWGAPRIEPLSPIRFHPAAKTLHYAQSVFESMKAYRAKDDTIRVFRPIQSLQRLSMSAERAFLPKLDVFPLAESIRRLVEIDEEWVPGQDLSALYIRPVMFGTEPTLGVSASKMVELVVILSPVGPYFHHELDDINVYADPSLVRASPGGAGYTKMGSNYAGVLWMEKFAQREGCHANLWLSGKNEEITGAGSMNIFAVLKNSADGSLELLTPSLDQGVVEPGITRFSVIQLAKEWGIKVNETKLPLSTLLKEREDGRLLEMFGTGTAATIVPIGNIMYKDKLYPISNPDDHPENTEFLSAKILKHLGDIQYGRILHPWAMNIEEDELWTEEAFEAMEGTSGYHATISKLASANI